MAVFTASGCSDRGPVRRINEDAFFISPDTGLLVVADGMGGHAAGEVASRLAVEAISGFIDRSHGETEYSWPYGVDPNLSLQGNRLRTSVHLANRRVYRAAESHDDYTGMGTTVVAALVGNHHATIAHVGDSRVYVMRDGDLEQITRDDSWAATVLGLRDADSSNTSMRNVLTNVLGAKETTDVHVRELRITPGERLLLCSDGLHGALDEPGIRDVLLEHAADPGAAATALVRAALDAGSRDNVTALVAVCEAE